MSIAAGRNRDFNGVYMHRQIYYAVTDSTNERLKALADEAENGLVAVAGEQTAGKGRIGRKWQSQPGQGAWFSVLLKDERLNAQNVPGVVFVCALAAARSLNRLCQESGFAIKWPNDIVHGGKKICGILCESGMSGDALQYAVAGIGINLKAESFGSELPWAASVRSETGFDLDADAVIGAFLNEFDIAMEQMYNYRLSGILDRIRPLSATLGRMVRAENGENSFTGTAEDFGPDGSLIIRDLDGIQHTVHAGDVSVRGVMGYV